MPSELASQVQAAAATLEELERQFAQNPDQQEVLLSLARAYCAQGRFHAQARQTIEKALLARPDEFAIKAEVARLVGRVEDLLQRRQWNTNEIDDLRREVSLRVDEYPYSPDLHKILGDLRVLSGRSAYAVESYIHALELGYDDPAALFAAYDCKKDELVPEPSVLEFFSQLEARLKRENQMPEPKPAETNTHPVHLSEQTVESIVQKHLEEHRVEDAIAFLERMSLQDPSPKFAHRIARVLIDDGRPLEAFLRLKEIPMDAQAKVLLNETAAWLERDEHFSEAVEVLRFINDNDLVVLEAALIHEQQIEISSAKELADLHFKTGRKLEAFRQYLVVLRSGVKDIADIMQRLEEIVTGGEEVAREDLLFLAEFFRDRGERFRAVRFLNYIFLFPGNLDESEWQRISKTVDVVLAAEPTQPPLCLELGRLCQRLGRVDRAVQEFILATAEAKLQPDANRALAMIYSQTGQYVLALERYREVKPNADDLQSIYNMIEPLEQSEAKTEVYDALKMISDVDPAFLDVAQRLAKAERHSSSGITLPNFDPKMRALIGDLSLGRYRFIDKIGTGGMGVVYKVFDIKHNCNVAMKILRESLASSPKAMTRFIREAQYVDQLNHPNIVHIFDFNISKVSGQSFIAMEYVDGPSMRQLLEDTFLDNHVTIDQDYINRIVDYCMQMCDALDATHREGIVHRDIKPDNVMINSRGIVKITDFGILHHEEMAYTPTGAVIGTPRYMSPEQVSGEHVDGRSDIYALGILMYEMLTSTPPFISGDIAYQQLHNIPPPPRSSSGRITGNLQDIILKCLQKNPEHRYQVAHELREELREELIGMGGKPTERPGTEVFSATDVGTKGELEEDLDFD